MMSSGTSEEIKTIATPSLGDPAKYPVDLGLGADVDAARRLVQDEHARVRDKAAAENDLLLIAAGQGAKLLPEARDSRVEPRNLRARLPADGGPLEHAGDGEALERRRYDIVGDRHGEKAARSAPVGGHEGHAAADGGERVGGRLRAVDRNPALARAKAEQRLAKRILARVRQAADAKNLARTDLEADRRQAPAP